MKSTFFRMRIPKSTTRDLADREIALKRAETAEWRTSTSTFFVAFVVIAVGLALAALVVR